MPPRLLLLTLGVAVMPLAACNSYADRPGAGYRSAYAGEPYYLRDNDNIYRDRDGRYYCRRPDGTTGAIVGGLAGGVLGNVIAPGGSKTLGTLLGAGAGALAGREIDRSNVRCE